MVKRSLRTRASVEASRFALQLAEQQAQRIRKARELGTSGECKSEVGPDLRPAAGGEGYTLIIRPDGTVEMKVEGKGSRSTNGVDRIGALMVESYVQKLVADPAAGQILFRKKEKRARRVHGFKAFSPDHIRILYSPEALEGLSEAARWGAWIGLYTGARVAEVGQLALADFVIQDGIPSIRITNECLGQSVKNDASLRTIPIHPALLDLGLLDRVEELRAAGEIRLFPRVKMDGVNGAGNWLSKAFSRHVTARLRLPEKGRFGFHSLRKSVVQGLQTVGVPSELRAAYVWHELGTNTMGLTAESRR